MTTHPKIKAMTAEELSAALMDGAVASGDAAARGAVELLIDHGHWLTVAQLREYMVRDGTSVYLRFSQLREAFDQGAFEQSGSANERAILDMAIVTGQDRYLELSEAERADLVAGFRNALGEKWSKANQPTELPPMPAVSADLLAWAEAIERVDRYGVVNERQLLAALRSVHDVAAAARAVEGWLLLLCREHGASWSALAAITHGAKRNVNGPRDRVTRLQRDHSTAGQLLAALRATVSNHQVRR